MVQEFRRIYYKYRVGFVRGDMMEGWYYFPFYLSIIELGIWASLSYRAKILYLAMRYSAFYDECLYKAIEGVDNYLTRQWEVCAKSLAQLCRLGNISDRNLTKPLIQLEKFRLINRFDRWIKVWLAPWPDDKQSMIKRLSGDEVYQYYGGLIEKLELDRYKKYRKIYNKT